MNYKNAFKCKKCPESNKEDGCPAWNEIIMTNSQSGETKIQSGCFYQMMPALLVESMKSSNVAASTHAEVRNDIARGFAQIAGAMPGFVEALAENIENTEKDDEVVAITAGSED